MDAEIINVGSEILTGDMLNNCQQFLVTELANIDVNVYGTNTAGNDPQRLRELLSIALSRSEVIILVGGMGPNLEDITKQTVCEALGIALVPHEISRKRIEEYCAHNGVTITPTVLSMSDMPAGSVVFRNDNGMCPGCAIRSSKQCIIMLPASVVEITPMVRNYVSQYLKQLTDGAVFSQVINVFYLGLTLHDVEEKLGGLLNSANPTVKCTEMTGEVRIRVTAKTNSDQASRELAAPVIRQILERFGDDAYGMNVNGLEEVVVRALKERKMTLSSAESCTAGIISKRVTDIPGSSRVFEMGATTYSSNKKSDVLGVSDKIIQRYGAVSPEAAAAMAVGARRLAGSTLAVSTTGIAGPGGGTPLKPVGLVYIALADRENVWIKKTLIQKPGMDRDYVRQVAASHALNLVRKYINCLPYLMPGYEPLGEGVKESYFEEATVLSPQAIRNFAASVPIASLGNNGSEIPESVREIVESATRRQQNIIQQPIIQIGSSDDGSRYGTQSENVPYGIGTADAAAMEMNGVGQPGIGTQGTYQQPGMNQQGMNQQNMYQPGMGQQGMYQQPGMNRMGMNQQNMYQPGMGQQGMYQQPGMNQQGAYGQGAYPPGMYPPGMYPQNMNSSTTQQDSGSSKGKDRNSKKKNEMTDSGKKKSSKSSSVYASYGKRKKKASGADIAYRAVLIVALLTLFGAGGYLGVHYYNEAQEQKLTARDDSINEDLSGQYSASMDFSSNDGHVTLDEDLIKSKEIIPKLKTLYEENPDTIGWIKVNNTVIDYVVMQRKVEDELAFYSNSNGGDIAEEYYLHKNFYGEYSNEGSIFAFFSNNFGPDGLSRNTILFGHHMRSGRMFQNLMKYDVLNYNSGQPSVNYSALEFYKENPIILFDTLYEEARWVVFAVVKADPYSEARSTEINWMFVGEPSADEQQAFIDNVRARSVLDTTDEIEVTPDDHLLIMQTCSYETTDMRTLVIARKLRDGETSIDVSTAHASESPILPSRLCKAKGYS